jgi:hypothetical protein
MCRNAVTNASGPSQELGVVIPNAEICGERATDVPPTTGNKYRWVIAGRSAKRLIVFLAILAALLVLVAAWRPPGVRPPLQDWLSPQRVGEFMTRFCPPGGRALAAISEFTQASVLMAPLAFLAVVGSVAFSGRLAFAYVLVGALLVSALGFVGGRWMSRGRGELEPISGLRLKQLSRQLAKRGTIAAARLALFAKCWLRSG